MSDQTQRALQVSESISSKDEKGICPECGMDWRPVLEASDLTSALPRQKAKWRRKMNLLVWLYVVAMVVGALVCERSGGCKTSTLGPTILGILIVGGPLGALMAGFAIGERRVERRVSREAGVFCHSCGESPDSTDLPDWIAENACGKCGGKLERDFSELTYKDSWPEWIPGECGACEQSHDEDK